MYIIYMCGLLCARVYIDFVSLLIIKIVKPGRVHFVKKVVNHVKNCYQFFMHNIYHKHLKKKIGEISRKLIRIKNVNRKLICTL